MKPVLILGVGSPWGDDQLGWKAVEFLRGRLEGGAFDFEQRDRPGAALLNLMKDYPKVLLLDAMQAGLAPGSVQVVERSGLLQGERVAVHGFGVAEALALGEALGMLPQELILIGIEAGPEEAMDREALLRVVRQCLEQD